MDTRRSRFLPHALGLLAAVGLLGCIAGSDRRPSFPEGHYFLAGRFDVSYAYEQYFVALPDHRFEWVEYGYNAATGAVCKATRKKGTYVLADSSVRSLILETSEPLTKCGMGRADFDAIKTTAVKDPKSDLYRIRELKADGFEAEGFFGAAAAWKHYPRRADPYKFHE